MTTLKRGTLRLITRWNENGVGPVVGVAIFPLPDGAREGDLIEIILGPNGKATWSVLAHDAIGTEGDSPWPNAYTYDHLFACGYVQSACTTKEEAVELRAQQERPMRTVRPPQVEARFDALWPLVDAEPFNRLAVETEIRAIGRWIGDESDPDLVRAATMASMYSFSDEYDETGTSEAS